MGDEEVCILLYADDIVLLADNKQNLQVLLNTLNEWCNRNDLSINVSKSNIVHFRFESVPKSFFLFICGDHV